MNPHNRAFLRRENEGGFTLVELLIVVVILGILAGIVVFAVGNLTDSSNISACKTEAETFRDSAAAFRTNHNANLPGNGGATLAGTETWQNAADDLFAAQIISGDHASLKYIVGNHAATPNWSYTPSDGSVSTANCT